MRKVDIVPFGGMMILLIATMVFNLLQMPIAAETSSVASVESSITATGKSSVKIAPDMATINIGVRTEGRNIEEIQDENAKKMNKIMDVLKKEGLKDSEIKTINYSLNPKYEWNEMTRKSMITGYIITNTVEATINDIDNVGNVIDVVVESGSNVINSIRFGLKNEGEVYNQALELAVEDAKDKALAMGRGVDAKNIKAVNIVENNSGNQGIVYADFKEMSVASDMSTPVSEGEMDIDARVTVDFVFSY